LITDFKKAYEQMNELIFSFLAASGFAAYSILFYKTSRTLPTWLFILSALAYLCFTYAYFEGLNCLVQWLRLNGFIIEMGHAGILLVMMMFVFYLFSIAIIILAFQRRKRVNPKSKESLETGDL
jgi:hypothetical protein